MMKQIFNSRMLHSWKKVFEKTPSFLENITPFATHSLSLSLVVFPFIFPSSRLICFVGSMVLQNHNKSSLPILQSSFLFYENQVNPEGKPITIYNKTNILLATFGTAVLGSILVYFLYPRNPRPMISVPLPKLPESKVIVPLLATKEDLLALKTNCLHVDRMYELLTKFVTKAESKIVPPIEVQKNFLKWVYTDKEGMKQFLIENKEWFIPFSVNNPSALTCVATLKKLEPLYELSCETSLLLRAYCDFLAKNKK
jgi:hypothetical protein